MIIRKPVVDGRIERQIVIGMIMNTEFIRNIQPLIRPHCFQLSYNLIISQWCLEYFQQYKEAPGRNIVDLFLNRSKQIEPNQAQFIEELLASLSDEYEHQDVFNVKYALDQAESYFRTISLQQLREGIGRAIAGGRVEDGEALVAGFSRVVQPETKGLDLFNDPETIAALEHVKDDAMFGLSGDLGRAVGDFERGWLIAMVGNAGVGKTWWLQYLALRALFFGYNVLFVSLEMSERHMIRRILQSITGKPVKKYLDQTILLPVFDCALNQDGTCSRFCKAHLVGKGEITIKQAPTDYVPCTNCRSLSESEYVLATWFRVIKRGSLTTKEARDKLASLSRILLRGVKFRLVQFPSASLTVSDLRSHLENLEYYDGFVPDVIVTDFADKFRGEGVSREYRHQINEIWEKHKALAQEKHCLVITASHANTARTGKDIRQGNWAEDIRKSNLVDVAMALNQTVEEKRKGIMRVRVLKQRYDEFDETSDVYVLQQLKIGRPYLDSYWPRHNWSVGGSRGSN